MSFELSEATRKRVSDEIVPRYPRQKSAILPVLWAIQDELGYIPREGMLYAAEVLDLPPAHVYGVLTFYTMFQLEPIGRYHLQVCRTASCEIMGCKSITGRIKEKLGIDVGETTADKLFTLTEVECLACCEIAPMMQINEDNYGPLTPESVDTIVDELKAGKLESIKPCL